MTVEYIQLSNPPRFDVELIERSAAILNRYQLSPTELGWAGAQLPRVNDFTFGAKARQSGARPYNHELKLEYFAVAKQLLGSDRFILVDRDSSSFVPTVKNKRSYSFTSDKAIEFMEYTLDSDYKARGKVFFGGLVTLTDKRGEIIAYNASNPWLWKNLENLRKLPVGAYMNKSCERVHPASPKSFLY